MVNDSEVPAAVQSVMRLAASALVGLGADMATAQVRGGDGTLRLAAAVGFDRSFEDHFAVVGDEGTACALAATSGGVVEVCDVATDPIYGDSDRVAMLSAGSAACISAPILQTAVLSAHYRQPGSQPKFAVLRVANELRRVLAHIPNLADGLYAANGGNGSPNGAGRVPAGDLDTAAVLHEDAARRHEEAAAAQARLGNFDQAQRARSRADSERQMAAAIRSQIARGRKSARGSADF